MSTNIRTAKATYVVESIHAPHIGPHYLVVRSPSGKKVPLHRAKVGRPRFDSAVAHFYGEQRRTRRAEANG